MRKASEEQDEGKENCNFIVSDFFLFWNLISRISFLDTANNAEQQQNSKSKQFMDSMAQKSQMEVPTEFLNTIREEKHENKQPATSAIEPQITKKYPFNR